MQQYRLPGWVAFWIAVVFVLAGMLSAAIFWPPRAGPSAAPQVPPTGGAALRVRSVH